MHFPPKQYCKLDLVPGPTYLNRPNIFNNMADSEQLWPQDQCPSGQRIVNRFYLPTQFQSMTVGAQNSDHCLGKNSEIGLSRKGYQYQLMMSSMNAEAGREAPKPGICHLCSRPFYTLTLSCKVRLATLSLDMSQSRAQRNPGSGRKGQGRDSESTNCSRLPLTAWGAW